MSKIIPIKNVEILFTIIVAHTGVNCREVSVILIKRTKIFHRKKKWINELKKQEKKIRRSIENSATKIG